MKLVTLSGALEILEANKRPLNPRTFNGLVKEGLVKDYGNEKAHLYAAEEIAELAYRLPSFRLARMKLSDYLKLSQAPQAVPPAA